MKTKMIIYEIDHITNTILLCTLSYLLQFIYEICKLLHIKLIPKSGLSLLMTDAAISRSCICLLCIHFDQKILP